MGCVSSFLTVEMYASGAQRVAYRLDESDVCAVVPELQPIPGQLARINSILYIC